MPTTLEHSQYGFDRDSRRTWQKRALTSMQDQCYGYDTLSQMNAAALGSLNSNLTAIAGVPAAAQSWEYDPTGNWRGYHAAANGTATLDQHRVHDRGNRMTQIEGNPHNMILDRVGRMRQMAPDASGDWDGKLEITWDAWSRITSVKDNGEVVGEYTYDGLTRRVTREVGGETLHSYYNDQWRPVEERKDAETTAAVSYLWGARHRDDLVRRDRAVGGTMLNETRYVLMDYFNPAALTDEEGEVTERYAFSAFGVCTVLNSDFTVRSGSECGMEFGFHGQFIDLESGLMNYGYRYYSPHLGRWTCKDPIGERGGINLYGMVHNNPVNHVDYLGWRDFLDPWSSTIPNTGATEKDINELIAELKALESVVGKKDGKKCFDVEIHRNAGTDREFLVASRTCDIPFYIAHGSNPKDPTDPNDRTLHPDGTNNTGISQSGLYQHSSVNGMGQPQCYGCQMKPYPDRDTPINTVMRSLTQAIKALKEQKCCPKIRKVCLTVGLDNSGEPSRNGGSSPAIPSELQPQTPLSNR